MIGSAVSINNFHKRGLILLTLTETLVSISDWMYLYILVGLLIAVGLFLSIRLGFVQIRLFPETNITTGLRNICPTEHAACLHSA